MALKHKPDKISIDWTSLSTTFEKRVFLASDTFVNAWNHLPQCRISASVNSVCIGSNNGLSPDRRQAIIWTNAGILLIRPIGKDISEIRIKMSSGKWRIFCPGEMHMKYYPNRSFLQSTSNGINGNLWYQLDNNVDGVMQKCGNSGASAGELLQFCTEPLMWCSGLFNSWITVNSLI